MFQLLEPHVAVRGLHDHVRERHRLQGSDATALPVRINGEHVGHVLYRERSRLRHKVNGGVTGGLFGVLAALTFGVACSSTTTHADGGGAGTGGGGRGVSQDDSGADVDASDASVDGGPSICAEIRPLVLSDPVVISGSVAGGQTVTMQITLTDTDPNGYVSYPGAILTSSTPGVSFAPSQTGPPGAYIDGTMSKPMTFYVTLAATIPAGTDVQISARAFQSGHTAPDCNAFVLSFSLTTI
jgi:hypothetical protein